MTQERMREVLTEPLTAEHMARRSSEGWIPVAVEWQREAGASTTEAKGPRIQVPYGLEVAEGGGYLQESGVEMAVLRRILSQIVDDRPLSEIAERLSELGSAQQGAVDPKRALRTLAPGDRGRTEHLRLRRLAGRAAFSSRRGLGTTEEREDTRLSRGT